MRGLAQIAIAQIAIKMIEELPRWRVGDLEPGAPGGQTGEAPVSRLSIAFLTAIALRPVPSPLLPPRAWS